MHNISITNSRIKWMVYTNSKFGKVLKSFEMATITTEFSVDIRNYSRSSLHELNLLFSVDLTDDGLP